MALLSIARFFAALLSLGILAAAGYLLWSWYDGRLSADAAGLLIREREPWRLWTGLALLAWSFLGGRILPLALARADVRPTRAARGQGRMTPSPTGSRLYVEEHGPAMAPTIIFTHGWGMDSTFWSYAREDLSDRFRLMLWDLPGLGRSKPANRAAISLSAFSTDLASLIERCGPQPVVLVGHSIGGMIIQTLAREHPALGHRIAGAALLNTTYTNPLRTMVFSRLLLALQQPLLEPAMKLTVVLKPLVWLSNWQSYLSGSAHLAHRLGFGRFATRSQLEHTTLLATRNSPAAQAIGDLAMLRWDAAGALARLGAPVLVIGGNKDIVTKLEASREIARQAGAATLQVVEDVNHMGPMERADLYDRLIADFALRVQPSASDDLGLRSRLPAEGGAQPPGPGPNGPPPRLH